MKKHWLRNTIMIVILLGVLVALAILFGVFRSSSVASSAHEPLTDKEMTELIPRGRALSLAGDCVGCHSQTQGPQAAGGTDMPTPFGTIYSTNITPDKQYGIGNYTRADFHQVLRDGIAPGNRNLYPAMPFVFTHITEPEDIDAIYAYIMSLEPLKVPNKSNTGVFKLPVRPFVNFWALFNFPDRSSVLRQPDRSEQWVRGAYLVEGLAHCAACHTPRNFMMGMDFSRNLEGGEVDELNVPAITAEALSKHGFDVATLKQYLQTGISPQGIAFSEMQRIIRFSTSVMDPSDVEAMSVYLLTDYEGNILKPATPPLPLPKAALSISDKEMEVGRQVYSAACAGCHGVEGEGIPNVSPAMQGNSILAMDDPHNTISVVLNGLPTQQFSGNQRMYAMPPFANRLSHEEVMGLTTWMRAKWGGKSEPVTLDQVEKVTRAVD